MYTSGALAEYSYDKHDTYSPPIAVQLSSLAIPNSEPLLLALRFNNNGHNLQLPIDSSGLRASVQWAAAAAPGPAPKPHSTSVVPGTAAAAVLRGPLLYSLWVGESSTVVTTWAPFNNTDVNLDSSAPWNYALLLDDAHPLTFHPAAAGPNRALPFNTSKWFASISATARQLPAWKEETNAAAEPPTSPVDCASIAGGCSDEVVITLVPYGATNLRMSGLPWIARL